MTDTIPIAQTRTVPQLTAATFPLALTDLLILHLPVAHDGATLGDFKLELEALRNWLLANAQLTGTATAPDPGNEPDSDVIVTVGWINSILTTMNNVIDGKLDTSAYNDHYRGAYVDLPALATAIPAGNVGDYATVDAGNGENARAAIWDDNDAVWVDVGSISLTTTDALPEGNSNFYVTQQHVLDTFTRQTVTINVDAAIPAGDSWTGNVVMSPQYRILQVEMFSVMRLRIYTNAAKRDADLARGVGVAVPEGSGLMFEFVSAPGLMAADLTPLVDGFAATASIPYSLVAHTANEANPHFSLTFVKTGV